MVKLVRPLYYRLRRSQSPRVPSAPSVESPSAESPSSQSKSQSKSKSKSN